MLSSRQFAFGAGSAIAGLALLGFVPYCRRRLAGVVHTQKAANFSRLALGVWGLWASRDEDQSEIFNKSLVALYGGLAVLGLFPRVHNLGFLPLEGSSLWLHAGGALAAAVEEDLLPAPSLEMLKKVYAEA